MLQGNITAREEPSWSWEEEKEEIIFDDKFD